MSDAGDLKPTNNPEGQAEIPGAYQQAPYQQPPIAQPGYPVNQQMPPQYMPQGMPSAPPMQGQMVYPPPDQQAYMAQQPMAPAYGGMNYAPPPAPAQQYAPAPGMPVMVGQQPMAGAVYGQQPQDPNFAMQANMGPQPITVIQQRQLRPISMDESVDKGPPAQFDKEYRRKRKGGTRVIYHLRFPESDENQIVARCQSASVVKVVCEEPKDGIVMGNSPNYSVDWKASSWVAEVVDKDEIEKFMAGLETEMKPICEDLQSMRRWLCLMCCILCLTLAIIGI